jgi:hypothetical protein
MKNLQRVFYFGCVCFSTQPFRRLAISEPPHFFGYSFFLLPVMDRRNIPMDEARFNRLSLADRAGIVWQKGKFVDSVIYNNYCLMLYSVNRQFVELFLDLKTHAIVWISMANEYDLAKYLDDIKIEV